MSVFSSSFTRALKMVEILLLILCLMQLQAQSTKIGIFYKNIWSYNVRDNTMESQRRYKKFLLLYNLKLKMINQLHQLYVGLILLKWLTLNLSSLFSYYVQLSITQKSQDSKARELYSSLYHNKLFILSLFVYLYRIEWKVFASTSFSTGQSSKPPLQLSTMFFAVIATESNRKSSDSQEITARENLDFSNMQCISTPHNIIHYVPRNCKRSTIINHGLNPSSL